jgi:hypothetical protein
MNISRHIRATVLVALLLSFSIITSAQTVEDSVKATVNALFTGMRTADSAMVESAFADSAILQGIGRNREGNTVVTNQPVSGFSSFVAKVKAGDADERITFEIVRIDGPLAVVVTPYQFYYKGKFSHCGINTFQLVRFRDGWKIQYLIDTRRREGCDVK